MTQLLTVEETADILRVHPDTIRLALKRGELDGFRIGKLWRVKAESVAKLIGESVVEEAGKDPQPSLFYNEQGSKHNKDDRAA